MSEVAEFFEAGKTYVLDHPDAKPPVRLVFQCLGAGIIPERAIGAGGRVAFGYQHVTLETDGSEQLLTLMTQEAWARGWVLANGEG